MNEFMSWEMLLTYGGCVAATVLVTEWLKKLMPKIAAQLISFAVALLILVVGHLATGTFVVGDILLYLVNAIAVSLASNGGFDALKGIFGKKEEAQAEGPIENQMILDPAEKDGVNAYFSFAKNPNEYKEGEVIKFVVSHKKDSQDKPIV